MSKGASLPVALNDWYKINNAPDTRVFNDLPSLTRQEFAAECDINEIMAKYETTGQLPANRQGLEPLYVDFTSMPSDLMSTMAMMDKAQEAFMLLPAKVRREFDNDPHAFVNYASDPASLDQLREWGLAPPLPPDPAAVVVPVAAPPAPSDKAPPAPPKAE